MHACKRLIKERDCGKSVVRSHNQHYTTKKFNLTLIILYLSIHSQLCNSYIMGMSGLPDTI